MEINIWLLRFFLKVSREFTVFFFTFDNVSLSNGFRGWKNAFYAVIYFLQTGFRNSFPLEFIFLRKFLEGNKFLNKNAQKVNIRFQQKRSNFFILCWSGSGWWRFLLLTVIWGRYLKCLLTGKSSWAKKQKKFLAKLWFIEEISSF